MIIGTAVHSTLNGVSFFHSLLSQCHSLTGGWISAWSKFGSHIVNAALSLLKSFIDFLTQLIALLDVLLHLFLNGLLFLDLNSLLSILLSGLLQSLLSVFVVE